MAFRRVMCLLFLSIQIMCANFLKIDTPNYTLDEHNKFLDTIWNVVSTLGADTPDLSIKKSVGTTGIELEFTTQDDFKYHFFPVRNTSMQLAVKAPSDVYIAFSSKPYKANPTELIIGGSSNTKTSIQRSNVKKEEVDTPGILNAKEYSRFLVSWSDGVIQISRTGEQRPIISWVLPQAVPVGYIGVRTGDGVSGSWLIEDLDVANSKEFNRKDANILRFKVKTSHDAHIGLFTKPSVALNQGQMIEVLIGGWSNTRSLIRRGNYGLNDVVTVEVPGLLNGSEYRGFWLHWGDVISVGREGEHCPFMTWPDPSPFPQVLHLGLHTGYGAAGIWKIEDWKEIETPDHMVYTYHAFAAHNALADFSFAAIDSW